MFECKGDIIVVMLSPWFPQKASPGHSSKGKKNKQTKDMNANVSEILWGQENNYYINLKMTMKDKMWKLYKLYKISWDLNYLQKTPKQ